MLHSLVGGLGVAQFINSKYVQDHVNAKQLFHVAEEPFVCKFTPGWAVQKIYNYGWAGLDEEATRDGLDLLQDLHWLVVVRKPPGPTGGRPSEVVNINPRVNEL